MTRIIGWTFLLAVLIVVFIAGELSLTDSIFLAGWLITGAILAK